MATLCISKRPRARFQYLWFKYVEGFDDKRHCLPCLIGPREHRVSLDMPANQTIELRPSPLTKFGYLCGSVGEYATNLHVAVEFSKTAKPFRVEGEHGYFFAFTGARRVEIPALPNRVRNYSTKQTTCRNFQFGLHYFGTKQAGLFG